MTLDMGSPFKVTAKPYIIAAVDQALPADTAGEDIAQAEINESTASDANVPSSELQEQSPGDQSRPTVLILVIVVLLVGIGIAVLAKRGQGVKR